MLWLSSRERNLTSLFESDLNRNYRSFTHHSHCSVGGATFNYVYRHIHRTTVTALRLKITNCWCDGIFNHAKLLGLYSRKKNLRIANTNKNMSATLFSNLCHTSEIQTEWHRCIYRWIENNSHRYRRCWHTFAQS